MAVIPDSLYRECEARLRNRWESIRRAQERLEAARARAYTVHAAPSDGDGARGGAQSDALERKAISVQEAEEQLRQALAWDDVARRLEQIFPPETREGAVYGHMYGRGMTQEETCRVLNVERKAVRRCRDALVVNCAMLAIQAGLIRMEDDNGGMQGMRSKDPVDQNEQWTDDAGEPIPGVL